MKQGLWKKLRLPLGLLVLFALVLSAGDAFAAKKKKRYADWKAEGVAWYVPVSSAKPVYRLYNPNAGDHHYTMSVAERDFLVSVGWNDEGVGERKYLTA